MAASFNRVFLMGRLTRDPEIRYLESGDGVANMRLAVSRTYTTRSGEQRDEVCYIDVEAWGRLAELCEQYLSKGRLIFVEGRLMYREWETETGERRSAHSVRALGVQFLDWGDRPEEGQAEEPAAFGAGRRRPAAVREPEPIETEEDDIPF
ncbi:MAG: hypothetical protein KatS3mg115_0733 [Candidatus Poribacteria bacterium]|nr:MAG: hypothetical protein KatS3mg115_0733 [Candidatus Poribacteria bacterium]